MTLILRAAPDLVLMVVIGAAAFTTPVLAHAFADRLWAAAGEADIRTVVDTARLDGASPFATILNTVGA